MFPEVLEEKFPRNDKVQTTYLQEMIRIFNF